MKMSCAIKIGMSVILVSGLYAGPSTCAACKALPEPSAIPEFVLCLAATVGAWFFRHRARVGRSRRVLPRQIFSAK